MTQPQALQHPEQTFWERAINRYRHQTKDQDSLDCEIRAKILAQHDAKRVVPETGKPRVGRFTAPEHNRDRRWMNAREQAARLDGERAELARSMTFGGVRETG